MERKDIIEASRVFFNREHSMKSFIPGETYIPPTGKVLDAEDCAHLIDASLDMWLTTGRYGDEFETKLAKTFGRKLAKLTVSGSAANLLAFTTLTSWKLGDARLKKGDEVITVAAGFPTTVAPIIQNGCIPVFVDIDINTHNVNVDTLEAAIGPKTRAVMLAHSLGNPFDVIRVAALCEKHNLYLIEDCCDAFGATIGNKGVGTFGELATLSFYPAHHITTGEGGAVLCSNVDIYKKLNLYRNLCFDPNRRFFHSDIGWNYRLGSLSAALANSQLKRGALTAKKKQEIGLRYYENLCELSQIYIPPPIIGNRENGYWILPILLKHGQRKDRDHFAKYLSGKGIGTRPFFEPLHLQKVFVNTDQPITLPNCTALGNMGLYIPSFVGISEDEVTYVVETIKDYFL